MPDRSLVFSLCEKNTVFLEHCFWQQTMWTSLPFSHLYLLWKSFCYFGWVNKYYFTMISEDYGTCNYSSFCFYKTQHLVFRLLPILMPLCHGNGLLLSWKLKWVNNSCELKSHWWEIQDDHLAFPSSLANLIVISWVKAFPDYLALLPHDGKKMVTTYVPCGVYLPQSLVIKVPPSPYRSYKPSLKLLETVLQLSLSLILNHLARSTEIMGKNGIKQNKH